MSAKIAERRGSRSAKRGRKIGGGFHASGFHVPRKGVAVGERIQFHKGDFAGAVKSFRKTFGISQEELGRITGFSTRSIAGWECGQMFSRAGRHKLVEMERLRAALAELMPADAVGNWLREPNPAIENQPPLQVIERGEIDRLWRMIFQIDAGVAN